MTILAVIRPIIIRTYGESEMSRALSERLAGRIAAGAHEWADQHEPPSADNRSERERMVAMICWDWMSGGATATAVAKQIEAALVKAGY